MLWGGIALDMTTELVVIRRRRNQGLRGDRYVSEVRNPHVRPATEGMGEKLLLAHKKARPHISRRVEYFLIQYHINVLDLNAIEHLEIILKEGLVSVHVRHERSNS
ncbi:hypothetical protein ANN_03310 [Periplaneta americana]|uniref:Uncharacterized protein n=1 Tax=Periplaneta americana TaxID=6978 RepID=A0ABQ8U245_PERAM|nr:hypothetical protein ANN_03310 [Periplaneta americana]